MDKERRQLDYLVYGWFRFEKEDDERVRRLGTQWVPAALMASDPSWDEKEDEFDDVVREMREPYA